MAISFEDGLSRIGRTTPAVNPDGGSQVGCPAAGTVDDASLEVVLTEMKRLRFF